MKFEVIETSTVYTGRVFEIRKEQVKVPGGQTIRLDVVVHRESVTMAPVDEAGNIWFIRQYRHPAGRELLELPAGVIEPGEEPQQSAQREMREETGMAADQFQLLGSFFLAPGYSTEHMYAYLATGLRNDPLKGDEDEVISIQKVPVKTALEMAAKGQVEDAKTLATLFLLGARL